MQPLRRYDVDAAILFSDILVLLEALGIDVTMPGGVGIQVPQPLSDPKEVTERLPGIESMTKEFVADKLGHVLASVEQIIAQMKKEKKSIPLIGFSAAPWTLLFYMVGGSSRKNPDIGMKWLDEHPEESTKLLELLTKLVVEYMSAQVEKGAHILQVFEAMGMMIDEPHFDKFAMPCLETIAAQLKERHPGIPLMVFSRGACFANEKLSQHYNVVTMDGDVTRTTERTGDVSVQGNYDPKELILRKKDDDTSLNSAATVRASVKQMLTDLGPQRLIANLGEGLGGKESPMLVKAFVNAIHEESEQMISSAAAAATE
mmetsp:Transcript_9003/g.13926  ORF Transcript_9003/g.13926 Transcript_9003/m.13926 type:complete len:316 (-) Transcript_9003:94-1041(-)